METSMRSERPRARKRPRGFALLAVIIILAMVTTAVAISLDEAVGSIQNAGRIRSTELIKGGLDHGLSAALDTLATDDPTRLADPGNDWDIFGAPVPAGTREYVPNQAYPNDGPFRGQYLVRVGLRPGQRARAPQGEDVREAFGQIVEVQVSVEATGDALPPAEERVSVGVLIPRRGTY
jgi:type II secretory pathway pseudopilin PulG